MERLGLESRTVHLQAPTLNYYAMLIKCRNGILANLFNTYSLTTILHVPGTGLGAI